MKQYDQIRVETSLKFVVITQAEFSHMAGEHVWLKLCGVIEEMKETGIALEPNTDIKVYSSTAENERLLFSGIPVSVKLEHGETMKVTLEAVSRTILMDIEIKSRSFQRSSMKYTELIRELITEYDGDFLVREEKPNDIETPFIQYKETDWQFLKRLASHYGCSLFASAVGERPKFYLGISEGEKEIKLNSAWKMKKHLEEYHRFWKKADILEQTVLQCEVKSHEMYQIGDSISCSDVIFQIVGIKGNMENGSFLFTYCLAQKEGLCPLKQQNQALKGSSVLGTVLAIEKNRIKLHLDFDEVQEESNAYWYPISRTDWYCMPEAGSTAALYFPSDHEQEAYVTAITRQDGAVNEKTQDSDDRYFGTADGKQMKLAPDSIRIHARENRIFMEFDEKKGIKIKSRESIHLEAGDVFRCHGKTVSVHSEERIFLHTNRTAIVIDDVVQVKG